MEVDKTPVIKKAAPKNGQKKETPRSTVSSRKKKNEESDDEEANYKNQSESSEEQEVDDDEEEDQVKIDVQSAMQWRFSARQKHRNVEQRHWTERRNHRKTSTKTASRI